MQDQDILKRLQDYWTNPSIAKIQNLLKADVGIDYFPTYTAIIW